jgi:hypothetical protein
MEIIFDMLSKDLYLGKPLSLTKTLFIKFYLLEPGNAEM